jgi:Spy/CpxP family protein refolding chaperone
MKRSYLSKVLLVVMLFSLVGFGGSALAFRGMGNCGSGGGPGWNKGGDGPGFADELTEDEIGKLKEERKAFLNETKDLRNDIYAKDLELKAEIAKKNPDLEKASKLQKELSGLNTEFDQKMLQHRIKMKKICPAAERGCMHGHGSGSDFGRGHKEKGSSRK